MAVLGGGFQETSFVQLTLDSHGRDSATAPHMTMMARDLQREQRVQAAPQKVLANLFDHLSLAALLETNLLWPLLSS